VDSGAAILCYSRDQSTGVANGTVDDCPSDLACYLYTKDKISYAGCGRCTEENTEDHNCESCTSDYCNDWPSLIGCFYAKSETKKENWLKISCNKKFCYSFNYTIGATYYAAGCGNCSGYEKFDTCRPWISAVRISCYSRDKSTGRANGTVSNCTSDSALLSLQLLT
uniref:Laminin EGF-like domain-containing protein n=1 Tax=Macrostomum lignano TaxID=282301 RepID=A0A1I8IX90_9PLAT